MAYMTGINRYQVEAQLLSLDEMINPSNNVRVIDAYVNSLDLSDLCFKEYSSSAPGQKAYNRKDLLKLHIYGYINKIRSSRFLEKECNRNIEVMWLINNLIPDHVTIANFVKSNKDSFKKVLRNLVALLREWNLIDDETQAVDGTKIKAVNSQQRYITINKTEKKLGDLDRIIDSYVEAISKSENEVNSNESKKTIDVEKIIERLANVATRKNNLTEIKEDMKSIGETQRTFTDPDCRGMMNNGKAEPCYNVQSLVDGKNKLIVDCVATNDINDLSQLTNLTMKNKIKDGTIVLADKGYFNMEQIIECSKVGMNLYIARPRQNVNKKDANYQKDKFKYDNIKYQYICPMGKILEYAKKDSENGITGKRYRCNDCNDCQNRIKCTDAKKGKTLFRREDEDIVFNVIKRTIDNPRIYKLRKGIVEHPFGTIKRHMGYTYFNRKGLASVNAEAASFCIAYNLKRLINILGVQEIIERINKKKGDLSSPFFFLSTITH